VAAQEQENRFLDPSTNSNQTRCHAFIVVVQQHELPVLTDFMGITSFRVVEAVTMTLKIMASLVRLVTCKRGRERPKNGIIGSFAEVPR
jgi:hypothetical protein